ncbi:tRNA 2-selenouridine(34) synthase MnmH [Lottiidibacillus patelloidae]|uniref:tRNA 2-selenouridine(34) synthase MnmH n=1 Tax=Lottiidibacillus patelloidae TaxID=2670334 RepID=A0A263BUW6_9BACI|nr:tRNA 2-selenouridine(34) synthase MnmH [Lottiidibacillus patelloidae]OZM57541.1 tRNA 2-selenouridine(34) synthase MnmH [Lottiidibacillus patelloidae]
MEVTLKDIEQIDARSQLIIDVRSPKEYEEFHIPEAINIPIFSDEERAKIGTIYKRVGEEDAKELGLQLFAPKLPGFYKQLRDLLIETAKNEVLFYCARGGMRSRSFVVTMAMMGLPCTQLRGGIRAFRQEIIAKLKKQENRSRSFIVLNGYTGSRKTDLLQSLKKLGYPVLDLEGLAGHRGSIFGQIGMKPNSQKTFEMLLVQELEKLKDAQYILIEGESKRIGKVVIPNFILQGKVVGEQILISYPLEKRVENIYTIYDPSKYKTNIDEALGHLEKRLNQPIREKILSAKQNGDYKLIYKILMADYYDQRYEYQIQQMKNKQHVIEMSSLNEGLEKLTQFLTTQLKKTS